MAAAVAAAAAAAAAARGGESATKQLSAWVWKVRAYSTGPLRGRLKIVGPGRITPLCASAAPIVTFLMWMAVTVRAAAVTAMPEM